MLVSSLWLFYIALIGLISLFIGFTYMTRNYLYWKRRGVLGPKPTVFFGNAWDIMTFKKPIGYWLKSFYDSMPDVPYFGIFVMDEPFLILKSPEVIKQILVKDFSYFQDRTIAVPEHSDLYANFIFFQKSPEWKLLRTKLTPTFTTGKMKSFFSNLNTVVENLHQYLDRNQGNLDAKKVCSKFTIDAVSKIFFEINAHCLDNENSKLEKIGTDMFAFTLRNGFVQSCYFLKSGLVHLFKLDFFEKEISHFFLDAFWKTVNSRKLNEFKNNNFIDILREIRKKDPTFGKISSIE